ncbi:hypothetical protein niasHT_023975 [Heterodera trifolii]|uniref:Effector protein n=1 Tax=Heterodera trifolii TaxID=157864 RepID=A0ABD2JVK4_9BILA
MQLLILLLFINVLQFGVGTDNQKGPRIIYLREPTVHQISPSQFRNFVIENTTDPEWKARKNANEASSSSINIPINIDSDSDDDDLDRKDALRTGGPLLLDFFTGKAYQQNLSRQNLRENSSSNLLDMSNQPNNSNLTILPAIRNQPSNSDQTNQRSVNNESNANDLPEVIAPVTNSQQLTDQNNLSLTENAIDQSVRPNQNDQHEIQEIFHLPMKNQQNNKRAAAPNSQEAFEFDLEKVPKAKKVDNSDQQMMRNTFVQQIASDRSCNSTQCDKLSDQITFTNQFDPNNLENAFNQSNFINFQLSGQNQTNNDNQFEQSQPVRQQIKDAQTQILPKPDGLLGWLYRNIDNSQNHDNSFDQSNCPNQKNQTNYSADTSTDLLVLPKTENPSTSTNQSTYSDQTNTLTLNNQSNYLDQTNSLALNNQSIYADQANTLALGSMGQQLQQNVQVQHGNVPTMLSMTTPVPEQPFDGTHSMNLNTKSNNRGQKRPFEEPSTSSSVDNLNGSGNELALGILPVYIEKPLALVVEGAPMDSPDVRWQFELLTKILRQMDAKMVEERIKEQMFKDEKVKNDNLLRHIFKKIQKQAKEMFGHSLFENEGNETEKENNAHAEILFFFMHLYNKMVKLLKGEHYGNNKNAEDLRVALHKWIKAAKERVGIEFQQFFKKKVTM